MQGSQVVVQMWIQPSFLPGTASQVVTVVSAAPRKPRRK